MIITGTAVYWIIAIIIAIIFYIKRHEILSLPGKWRFFKILSITIEILIILGIRMIISVLLFNIFGKASFIAYLDLAIFITMVFIVVNLEKTIWSNIYK